MGPPAATDRNCFVALGFKRRAPHKPHPSWLSAPPMPRSVQSPTLVVGSFPFPWIVPISWGFCGQKIGSSSHMLSPPSQALQGAVLPAPAPAAPSSPVAPTSQACFRAGGTGFSTSEEILAPTAFCPWEFIQFPAPRRESDAQ